MTRSVSWMEGQTVSKGTSEERELRGVQVSKAGITYRGKDNVKRRVLAVLILNKGGGSPAFLACSSCG